jgi:protein disulfide-isomerase
MNLKDAILAPRSNGGKRIAAAGGAPDRPHAGRTDIMIRATVTMLIVLAAAVAAGGCTTNKGSVSTEQTTSAAPIQTTVMEPIWIESYDTAIARSKTCGEPILADFSGSDWCPWCMKLRAEVFDTPEFKAWAKNRVILLLVDFPRVREIPEEQQEQNTALMDKYKVTGYPTVLFLDDKGVVIGQLGYVQGGPKAWTAEADKILARVPQKIAGPAAPTAGAVTTTTTQTWTGAASTQTGAGPAGPAAGAPTYGPGLGIGATSAETAPGPAVPPAAGGNGGATESLKAAVAH